MQTGYLTSSTQGIEVHLGASSLRISGTGFWSPENLLTEM